MEHQPVDLHRTTLRCSAGIIVGAPGSPGEFGAKDFDFPLCDAAEILGLLVFASERIDEVDQLLIAQCARVRERVQESRNAKAEQAT